MEPAILPKTIEVVTDAGKEVVSLVVNQVTGDNHPEYQKAVISGTAEALKELAKSDISTATRIYEKIKVKREQREFFNLSKILHKIATLVRTKPKEVVSDDNDFFWNTIEYAKSISNEEMQELIAKIIAGEYNAPGTYSMNTLQALKMLGKNELELFEKVCCLIINDKQLPKILFSLPYANEDFIQELGVDFNSLQLLQSFGLFFPNSTESIMDNPQNAKVKIRYFSESILFEANITDDLNSLKFKINPCFILSPAGEQLLKHLNPKPNKKYFDWLKKNYQIPNYKIIE